MRRKVRKDFSPRKFRLIFGGILFIVVLGLIIVKLWAGRNVEAVWYNTAWPYRQAINITNNGSTQTNWQFEITVNTAALITSGRMLSTCNDIRFADSTGTSQAYFIEKGCNTTTTLIWVTVASAPAGSSTIYMYYGNDTAASASTYTANGRGSVSIGDGLDGDIYVSGSQNINTAAIEGGHSCADGG